MSEIINIFLESVDSTNTYAKLHGNEFDPNQITCIIAEEQTLGRGRMNRSWYSPKGQNIYATFCFHLPIATPHLIAISHIMSLTAAMVFIEEGLHPQIKWPNDVLLGNKKVAGILCETEFLSKQIKIILGVGINVNMNEQELLHIDKQATSLLAETKRSWDRATLIKKLQKEFLIHLKKFQKDGFTPFHDEFENLLAYKGQTIRCFDGKKEWVGICHSITNDGQLNLYLPNHEMHTLAAGDIR